jgi:predicted enzyme related to lactoylglutathione lyase
MRIEVAIDVNDLELIITFYENLLGYQTHHTDTERFGPDQIYYSAVDPTGLGPKLIFQVVPEKPSAKNRIHLDLHVSDIEEQALRAVELGATRIDESPITEAGSRWIRLADPEGNVFCLVQPASA